MAALLLTRTGVALSLRSPGRELPPGQTDPPAATEGLPCLVEALRCDASDDSRGGLAPGLRSRRPETRRAGQLGG